MKQTLIKKDKEIRLGAIASYIGIFINILFAIIYTPWMVSKIGDESYGIYTLALSLITIFLMDFGLGSTVARFISKYKADNNSENINVFLGIVYKLYLLIDLVILAVFIIVYFLIPTLYVGLTSEEVELFKRVYIIVASYSIISFFFTPFNGILQAHEKFFILKTSDTIGKFIAIVLTVLALLCDYGVEALVCANALSGIVVILIKYIVIKKSTDVKVVLKAKDRAVLKEIFSFSIYITIASIAGRLVFTIAPSILAIMSNSVEIAIFAPINALESYFYTFGAAIGGLFLPKISKMVSTNSDVAIMDLMITVGRFQTVILGLVFVGFFCVGKEFLLLWMGDTYVIGYYGAVLIFIPDLLNGSQQIANTTLLAKNEVKWTAYSAALKGILCCILSLIFAKNYGAIGVSFAIAIAYCVSLIYNNVIYYRVLKFNMNEFYINCYLKTLPAIIGALVISVFVVNVIDQVGWMWLCIKIIIITIIYIASVYLFALKKEEKRKCLVFIKIKK